MRVIAVRTFKQWIEQTLDKLPFVEWDRFTHWEFDDGNQLCRVYGWIERDKDQYKDFVLIDFWKDDQEFNVITSSERYSEQITEILYDEDEEHGDCCRVEDHFDVENAIEIADNTGEEG